MNRHGTALIIQWRHPLDTSSRVIHIRAQLDHGHRFGFDVLVVLEDFWCFFFGSGAHVYLPRVSGARTQHLLAYCTRGHHRHNAGRHRAANEHSPARHQLPLRRAVTTEDLHTIESPGISLGAFVFSSPHEDSKRDSACPLLALSGHTRQRSNLSLSDQQRTSLERKKSTTSLT